MLSTKRKLFLALVYCAIPYVAAGQPISGDFRCSVVPTYCKAAGPSQRGLGVGADACGFCLVLNKI